MTRLAIFSTLIALGLAWGGPIKPGPDPSKYSRDYGIIETPEFKAFLVNIEPATGEAVS